MRQSFGIGVHALVVGPRALRTIKAERAPGVALVKHVSARAPVFTTKTELMSACQVTHNLRDVSGCVYAPKGRSQPDLVETADRNIRRAQQSRLGNARVQTGRYGI